MATNLSKTKQHFEARELANGKLNLKVKGGRDIPYTLNSLKMMSLIPGMQFRVTWQNGKVSKLIKGVSYAN